MKRYGDITKISGYDVPPVDVIIGGSPCQDLSVAGKRAGLQGERSGLFMEQISIIKEMRCKCEKLGAVSIMPRYMVWENVVGVLSSGKNYKGEDFRIVLEETARICEPSAVIPRPPGKWTNSGAIMGNGWSIAWRIHDAQFWGVPQRRRRIALVADFGGCTAPEILFERNSLSRNTSQSGTSWEDFASAIAKRFGDANKPVDNQPHTAYCLQGNGIDRAQTAGCNGKGWREDKAYTLITIDRHAVFDCTRCHENVIECETSPTVVSKYGTGGGNTPVVVGVDCYSMSVTGEHAMTITSSRSDINHKPSNTLGLRNGKEREIVCVATQQGGAEIRMDNKAPTLTAAAGMSGNNQPYVSQGLTVRRLTPLECERLQGFPDNWTDIGEYIDTKGKKRKTSDASRYKALGNSIALPFWAWLLERLMPYTYDKTMASLFDGIGGFPLIWETLGGKCLWASEIEEFCIAVTKRHFEKEEANNERDTFPREAD